MKYMLLMNYYVEGVPPITEWPADAITEHIAFQHKLGAELAESGELVDGQGAPVVTDGPFPESKEFLAGYWTVDVESRERAIEIAAKASAAPGHDGRPIQQVFQVRQLMDAPSTDQ